MRFKNKKSGREIEIVKRKPIRFNIRRVGDYSKPKDNQKKSVV